MTRTASRQEHGEEGHRAARTKRAAVVSSRRKHSSNPQKLSMAHRVFSEFFDAASEIGGDPRGGTGGRLEQDWWAQVSFAA